MNKIDLCKHIANEIKEHKEIYVHMFREGDYFYTTKRGTEYPTIQTIKQSEMTYYTEVLGMSALEAVQTLPRKLS